MRKLLTAVFALVAALAFFVVGSPSANAFGSEVLGCDAGLGWTANSCSDLGSQSNGTFISVDFSAANTSGTYATSWVVKFAGGVPITQACSIYYNNAPCISSPNSGSCGAASTWCQIVVRVGSTNKTLTAALTLTQSGRTRTITAAATIQEGTGPCPTC
jgi:hypothetical protein